VRGLSIVFAPPFIPGPAPGGFSRGERRGRLVQVVAAKRMCLPVRPGLGRGAWLAMRALYRTEPPPVEGVNPELHDSDLRV